MVSVIIILGEVSDSSQPTSLTLSHCNLHTNVNTTDLFNTFRSIKETALFSDV